MRCEGLIGQGAQIDRIASLIETRRLPHAILLSGPPGVGKSLAARFVAAAHLCTRHGCADCADCARVRSGSHPDFHLLEPEESRRDIRISQTRDLMTALSVQSYEGHGKVAIIDPADRMNEESQNAFLKTLEEPAEGTLLILVSSRPAGLLVTVLSRCQQFRFGRLSFEEMEEYSATRTGEGPRLPQSLAGGCPGRLEAMEAVDGPAVRALLIDYVTSRSLPSSVSFSLAAMSWAGEAPNPQALRKRIRTMLDMALSLMRDLVVLALGADDGSVRNSDCVDRLAAASSLYDPALVIHALGQMPESYADLEGYIDPGLVVENMAILIRDTRKRS